MSDKVVIIFSILLAATTVGYAQESKEQRLLEILGDFPTPLPLQVETLESVTLETGWRYKIEYLAEEANPVFDTPVDKIRAYLFVPDHNEGEKLPAMIAIHQDGVTQMAPMGRFDLGKLETAGPGGDEDQHYGLELFQRGYVVICPDRFSHGERRRIKDTFTAGSEWERDFFLAELWAGQILLSRRTRIGKVVYDLMRATDVLYSLDYVDKERIGAIGHSQGGQYLVHFMFVDKRIKVGVSSCGFYELLAAYNENAPLSILGSLCGLTLPGLAKIGRSADYLALLVPRPFLMTRGLKEMESEEDSRKHVANTEALESYARQRYSRLNANDKLKGIYFEGGPSFPPEVKHLVYQWLDSYLAETEPSGVHDTATRTVPTEHRLYQNTPNPFNPCTEIWFDIPIDAGEAEVTLHIYNIRGQIVCKLFSGEVGCGHHRVVWDGRNDAGQLISSGVYIYRLRSEGFISSRRMVLLR